MRFTCWTGLWTRRGPPTPSPRGVIYELAVCHGRTSERLPCRNPSTMSRFSSVFLQTPQHQVYSKISVFAHVLALALSQKQTVGLSSVCVRACVCVCVCVGPGDVWIFVTVDRLRHSRWAGESDGRQGGLVTLQSRAAKKKKNVWRTSLVSPTSTAIAAFQFSPGELETGLDELVYSSTKQYSNHPGLDRTPFQTTQTTCLPSFVDIWRLQEERMLVFWSASTRKPFSLTLSSCLGGSAFCDSFPIIKALNFPHRSMSDGGRERQRERERGQKEKKKKQESEMETKRKWADYNAEIARVGFYNPSI